MEMVETLIIMENKIPNNLNSGIEYEFKGVGRSYSMLFVRETHDWKQIFICNESVSKYWVNTMGGKRGLLSLDNPRETYIFPKLIPIEVHDWAISKMIDVSGMKISNANLAITMKIAKSMMIKAGYNEYSINLISSKIRDKAIEIIDIKQYEWDQVLQSQANQLPFG